MIYIYIYRVVVNAIKVIKVIRAIRAIWYLLKVIRIIIISGLYIIEYNKIFKKYVYQEPRHHTLGYIPIPPKPQVLRNIGLYPWNHGHHWHH